MIRVRVTSTAGTVLSTGGVISMSLVGPDLVLRHEDGTHIVRVPDLAGSNHVISTTMDKA